MINKEVAFNYITEFLYQDVEIERKAALDETLTVSDREELVKILADLKVLYNKAIQFNSNTQNQNTLTEQGELQKVIAFEQQKAYQNINNLNVTNVSNTIETMVSLKTSLQQVINDAKKAYNYVLWMYNLSFYLGLALIVVSVVFAAMDKTILAIAFGAIGLVDIVTHFMQKPPLELQSSRSNLAQLTVLITHWFSDLMNLNSYMANRGANISIQEINALSEKQNANTALVLELIEKYCEPSVSRQR